MMRAGELRIHFARSAADAAAVLAGEGPQAMILAGGTDLIPNMKRRQQTPAVLVSLRRAEEMRGISGQEEITIGAATTLAEIVRSASLRESHAGLFRAAAQVATPLIRNTATAGGNLCLDTRCNYYDQTYEWRRSIDFCMKAPGPEGVAVEGGRRPHAPDVSSGADPLVQNSHPQGTCWVAPSSPRCWAVSSSDLAPALIASGARVTLRSADGERAIPLEALYADDGMRYLTKRREEVLASIRVPTRPWRSTYWKLRRRGSFDFPVLGVAASILFGRHGVVEEARIVLGAVASRPLLLGESDMLAGAPLSDDNIARFAEAASKHAKPLDNTDFAMEWRKTVAKTFLTGVLRELRGDDANAFPLLMREAARPLVPTW